MYGVCEQVFAYGGVCFDVPTITYYQYLVIAKSVVTIIGEA